MESSQTTFSVYLNNRRNDQINDWAQEFSTRLASELKSSTSFPVEVVLPDPSGQDIDFSKISICIPVLSTGFFAREKDAWKELQLFKANCQAEKGGISVELAGGELQSRILPIKINGIPLEETRILEEELEGNLRTVDFIFDSIPGVERPLRVRDDEFGYGGTSYSSQINKIASHIIQVINALKGKGKPLSDGKPKEETGAARTVYLAWTSDDCKRIRDDLSLIFQKAGMTVLPLTDLPTSDSCFLAKSGESMARANCSVHILGNETGRKLDESGIPISLSQIEMAKRRLETDPSFKMFVWGISKNLNSLPDEEQRKLVIDIRNNIVRNMIFTNVPSPVQLVDDIRTVLWAKQEIEDKGEQYKVVFMYNFLDEEDADEIVEMLSDVVKVQCLNVGEDPDMDYGQVSVKYIKNSKMAVIFFCQASMWALPFAQQAWKMTGGASSRTPICLIGDSDNDDNHGKVFNAPNVYSKLTSKEMAPLEIKALFDKLTGTEI